jgi:hypothetical protein
MSRHRLDEGRLQPPTCTGIRIRSVHDAHIIFHAVMTGILPMVTRRLDTDERRMVRPGNVYVWEERGRHSEATGVSDAHPAVASCDLTSFHPIARY